MGDQINANENVPRAARRSKSFLSGGNDSVDIVVITTDNLKFCIRRYLYAICADCDDMHGFDRDTTTNALLLSNKKLNR